MYTFKAYFESHKDILSVNALQKSCESYYYHSNFTDKESEA